MPYFTSQFSIEIVGESHYQKQIKEAIAYKLMVEKDDLEYRDEKLTASLILEDDNKFDPGNAVRVDIENLTVGYLTKEDAVEYRKQLNKLSITNEACTCKAAAYGKRDDFGRPMKFGIWLYIEPNRGLEIGEPPKRKKFLGIF